jgi:hypothetical protein
MKRLILILALCGSLVAFAPKASADTGPEIPPAPETDPEIPPFVVDVLLLIVNVIP